MKKQQRRRRKQAGREMQGASRRRRSTATHDEGINGRGAEAASELLATGRLGVVFIGNIQRG